jgi:uncharacterized protein YndB with AHSA1/START domain
MAETVEVQRTIAAPADELWKLVSDVTRMGDWSPETTSCAWIGQPAEPVAGARFRGRNQRGVRRWSTVCTVVASKPGEVFAFEAKAGPLKIARWEYHFAPDGTSCRVTEQWIDQRGGAMKVIGKIVSGIGDRASHNRAGMESTLQALASATEN